MKAMKIENSDKGFALMELMVALAIIGILASIASPLMAASRKKAFDTTAKADLENAIKFINLYAAEHDTFPATVNDLISVGFKLSKNVTFTRFDLGFFGDGQQTVHMHIKHSGSANIWHANYPMEMFEIEALDTEDHELI